MNPIPSTDLGPRPTQSATRAKKLWGYFWSYRGMFLAGALALVVSNALMLAIPAQIGHAVEVMRTALGDPSRGAEARDAIVHAAMAIILLAIGGSLARVVSRVQIFNAGRFIEFDIRNALYDRLAEFSPRFYGSTPTGDVTSRVTNDVTHLRLFYAIAFLHIINTSVAYVLALNKMVLLDWQLTLWCLAPYPLLLLAIRRVIRALFEQTKVVQGQLSTMTSRVQENLAGVGVIRCYALEERESRTFGALNGDFFAKNMKMAVIRASLNGLMMLVTGAGTLVVLVVGSQRVMAGGMTLGSFVEFNGYVVALAFPTAALGWVFSVWNRGLASFERIDEILSRSPDIAEPEKPVELPAADGQAMGRIEMDGVSFAYGDKLVLEDISMTIEAGSTVAIVGRTGAGKSTLVRLLVRQYDPDAGEVRVDGVALPKLALREMRSEIGYVPQEAFLFSMTIGQNLRFGLDGLEYDPTVRRKAPLRALLPAQGEPRGPLTQEERQWQSARVVGLEDEIERFQEGMETLVGERGVTLSGGQKQRLTLGRALLVDPRILILDDALASVDTQTEHAILDHLQYLMQGRTSIVLTHRFNALHRMDRIFVLEQGRLVEQGTHDELVALGGNYAQMYERQKLEESLQS